MKYHQSSTIRGLQTQKQTTRYVLIILLCWYDQVHAEAKAIIRWKQSSTKGTQRLTTILVTTPIIHNIRILMHNYLQLGAKTCVSIPFTPSWPIFWFNILPSQTITKIFKNIYIYIYIICFPKNKQICSKVMISLLTERTPHRAHKPERHFPSEW